jgi:mannitol-1-phosphate 5-dehydrogenase
LADRNVVIFGAGKIGRSFIGQLFGRHDYGLVFVEKEQSLVLKLNRYGKYAVIIKGPGSEERLTIERVSAIHSDDVEQVKRAICQAGIMAVSVGKNALASIAPVISAGLLRRDKESPGKVLDIILAENMRSAAPYFRELLRKILPESYPLDDRVGLVETSIGKMVPLMTELDLNEDPLQVFAEPYNTLILDRGGFRGEIPKIPEFSLKDHMGAWVDRKAFIHNLGHATAAYAGHLKHPDAVYMYEVLDDPEIVKFTRQVMLESAAVLAVVYPDEFTTSELEEHVDDLLLRFRNRKLGDTVFRVGSDLRRKLGEGDRFMGIIRMAQQAGRPYGTILEAMSMGFCFRARDEQGKAFPGDEELLGEWNRDPISVLRTVCGLEPGNDQWLMGQLREQFKMNRPNR